MGAPNGLSGMTFPTTAAPSLTTWGFQYNGLNLGAGSSYGVLKTTGISDQPKIHGGDLARPRDHGELLGLNLMGGRDIELDFWAQSGGTNVQTLMKNLSTATIPTNTEIPLWMQFPNLPCLASMCRVTNRIVPMDIDFAASQVAKPVVQFHATDPRLYANPVTTSGSWAGNGGGGLLFNVTFNVTFGTSVSYTSLTIPNGGNIECRPILTITGPCTNPVVANPTQGWQLNISATLASGDTLVIDLDLGAVTYTSFGSTVGQPRKNWIAAGSIWPNLINGIQGVAPGGNTITFSSSDTALSPSAVLSVQSADAYLL